MTKHILIAALGFGLASFQPAQAGLLYGNNAGSSGIIEVDSATGTILRTLSAGTSNGRGVVVVGNTIYYTDANNNLVRMMDRTTGALTGTAFTVAGASGLATMAYDGTDFWLGDYSGTNNVYHYSPTGTLLGTIALRNCTSYCDGLEFAILGGQPRLISNRYDGGYGGTNTYDVYDLAGNVVQAALISQVNGTGIAFDGTDFFVSDVFGNRVGKYDSSGTFLGWVNYSSGGHWVEDLSADYQVVLQPGVPEPNTVVLLGFGLVALAAAAKRRMKR